MKRFADLSVDDLSASPVWRYSSGDGDASAIVEPTEKAELSESESSVYVVSTTFILADGTSVPGVCSPQDASGLDYIQPVLFGVDGHVRLSTVRTDAQEVAQHLRRRTAAVFPLQFRCNVPVDGVVLSGTIALNEALPNQALQLTVNLPPFGRSTDRS